MPTGSGKSAIYQIAGLLVPGATVVVSPLIALQRDQVDSLTERRLDAAELNSTLSGSEREEALEEVEEGELEYLFLAPEQFENEETIERLRAADVSLFVVDEVLLDGEFARSWSEDLDLVRVVRALGRLSLRHGKPFSVRPI